MTEPQHADATEDVKLTDNPPITAPPLFRPSKGQDLDSEPRPPNVTQWDQVSCHTPLESLSLNWTERQLPERERTKHVHRLHPYLGKYVPQLVEVFLRRFFQPGMTVLDPFSGSATTLVQANELGINAIGCDISAFNILIGAVKTASYNIAELQGETVDILTRLRQIISPSAPLFKNRTSVKTSFTVENSYLNTWYAPQALQELLAFRSLIPSYECQDFLKVVLSRAARSARLTTHFNLDFPKQPVTQPYECYKHSRVCSPTKTALKFLLRYCYDGFRRITEYSQLRTSASVSLFHDDSRSADFPVVDGVVTSPPYVGFIDYHEQHRYAYELLGLPDNREREIGPASRGQGVSAKAAYVCDMTDVFRNVAKRIRPGGTMVVVAGDKFNLYRQILDLPELEHKATIRRHVNRRTGRRSSEFFESVFVYNKR